MNGVWMMLGLVALVWLWPARWDPAIRFKEWTEGWHDKEPR